MPIVIKSTAKICYFHYNSIQFAAMFRHIRTKIYLLVSSFILILAIF